MYRVGLRLLDGLVVELFVEHLDFTQVVGNALRVESERDERLETTDYVVLCTRRTHTAATRTVVVGLVVLVVIAVVTFFNHSSVNCKIIYINFGHHKSTK